MYWIPDPNFSIPDPGFNIKKIPDPDPHQRVTVFLTPKIVYKFRNYYTGRSSGIRIRIFSHPVSGNE